MKFKELPVNKMFRWKNETVFVKRSDNKGISNCYSVFDPSGTPLQPYEFYENDEIIEVKATFEDAG